MIRVSKSIVGTEEAKAVSNIIENVGYLGMGQEVAAFEQELKEYIGNKNYECACINTGTAALHLALEAVTKQGDEVLVQSFTFVATYQAITAAGCIPVSCDIDTDSMTIDLEDAKNKLTNKTKVILPVLYASNPGDLDKVYKFAKKNKLRVIEDAAHAFGCTYKEKKIGAQGDIVCFSFDGIKNITSGEGGAVFTNDKSVINKIKDARLLGVEKDTEQRYKGERSWNFEVSRQGYRYHMSNIFAAIGRVQLKRFETEFAPKRKELANLYVKELKNNKSLLIINENFENIVPHIFPVRILNNKRNYISEILSQKEIQFGIHYKPNHLLKYFKSNNMNLFKTEVLYSQIITLPLHPEITKSNVIDICSIINSNI